MGFLLHIAFAIGAIALAEAGYALQPRSPLLLLPLCLVPHALSWWTSRTLLRGRFALGNFLQGLLGFMPPLLHGAAVLLLGWHALVSRWLGSSPPRLDLSDATLLLDLAPLALFEFLCIDARARALAASPQDASHQRAFQLRMGASAVVPLILYLSIGRLVSLWPSLQVRVEQVALLNAAYSAVLLVLFAWLLPSVLRHTLDTVPLPAGAERSRLEEIAAQAGFRCRQLLIWRTGGQMSNAAIVGVGRRSRVVLFTDALLAQLSPRELAAVYAHEIGHAKAHHVLVFASWTVGSLLCGELAIAELAPEESVEQLAGLGLLLLLWYKGFGYLSRRFELEADLVSLETTRDPEALVAALEQVGGFHARRVRSWRHFSVAERVLFLRAATRDAGVGTRLRAVLRRWRWAGAVLFVLGAGGQAWRLSRSWSEDLLLVDLRLGRYERAAGRLEHLEVEPELATLTRRALELEREGRAGETEELAERARNALLAREPDLALVYLDLAYLRGRRDCGEVADALRAALSGDVRAGREQLGGARAEWGSVLEPWLGAVVPQ